ncbi:hypothetical protein BE11_39520 [Sorangium cellulosum]|nr:hypothetical protein BE11_39520 [Sorangium cellulosum]
MVPTLLSLFVMSVLPVSTELQASPGGGSVGDAAGASNDAEERGFSSASGDGAAAGVEEDSIASCVVTCPGGDKEVSCPDGSCQCYCDAGGAPVCKCG